MRQCARRDGCGIRWSRAVESCSRFLLVRVRRRPRPPAAPAVRPVTGFGAAIGRVAGRRSPIGRRCQSGSRGGCRVSSSGRFLAARAYAQAGPLIVAARLGLPASTVWKVLRRHGASQLRLPAREPVRRYERSRPGELVHVDIKKLGRFWTLGKRVLGSEVGNRSRHAGWQYLHLAIDDHPGSPTASYCEANAPSTASPSSAAPSTGTPSAESPSSACSATTATGTAPSPGATPAPSSASSAATHDHGVRKPTARPRRSSRRCCASGPTASPTPAAAIAPKRSPATSAGTTNTDHTARSEHDRRSAASHRSVGPTARRSP